MTVTSLNEPAAALLGHTGTGEAVGLRYQGRTMHAALIGKSGFGKTTLLEHLILTDLRQGTGVILLDAHGDLTERIVELAPGEAQERIIVIEMNDERPFGLNLYECDPANNASVEATVDNVVEVFKKLFLDERQFYPVIEDGLRNSAHVVIANKWTMAEVPSLFESEPFCRKALQAITQPQVRKYWREYYEDLSPREQREQRRPVLNKINPFLERRSVQLMVSQQHTTLPFTDAFNRGGCLLVRLAGGNTPPAPATVQFLGLVFLAVLRNIGSQRASVPKQQRRRVQLYLDEYQRFATPTTQQMLDEFRKYEIGMTVAHQGLEGVGDRPPRVASLVLFQLDGEDAPKIVRNLDTTPRRTKVRVEPRTEAKYHEKRVDRWEAPAAEIEYARLQQQRRRLRAEVMELHSKVPVLADITRGYDRIYSLCYSAVCGCGRHSKVGGDFTGEHPPPKTTLADIYAMQRLFNPCPLYFTETCQRRKQKGPLLTASGLVGIYDVEEDPVPGEGNSLVVTRCERYFLRPEAADASWFAQEVRRYLRGEKRCLDRAWLASLAKDIINQLKELYKTTPFHFRLAPGTPSIGGERPGGEWMEGHWGTACFPSFVDELRTSFTELRRRMNEVDNEIPRIERQAEELYNTKRSVETVKTYLGHKRVEDEVVQIRTQEQFTRSGRIPVDHEVVQRQPWYEMVEEIDQSPADRAAELVTELTSLPTYVAYCKLLDEHGKPHEYRVRTPPPAAPTAGGPSLRAVQDRSRLQYGTLADQVEREIAGRQHVDDDDDEPPPIGRRPPKR